MRITKPMRSRLTDMFYDRMRALLLDDDRCVSTWTEYLESIGCRRAATKKSVRGFVVVDDPIWHDNKILMPRDLAMKVLVLEWLP